MAKRHRETSKVLLWLVIAVSVVFSLSSVVCCIIWAREELGQVLTVVGGLWAGTAPVAIGCYNDRAKAKDEAENQRAELEAQRQVVETENAALAENTKLKADLAAQKKRAKDAEAELTALQKAVKGGK